MVGLGVAMIGLGVWGLVLWRLGGPERSRLYLMSATAMGPAGFVAVVCGWVTAEVGRQPYLVYGLLRTADGVSPVHAGQVSLSLLGFLIIYAIVFSVGALYILRLIGQGPQATPDGPIGAPSAPGSGARRGACSEIGASFEHRPKRGLLRMTRFYGLQQNFVMVRSASSRVSNHALSDGAAG